MRHSIYTVITAASLAALVMVGHSASAQPPLGGEDRARGGRGRPDPEQMREMMLERHREALNPTEDEWAALEPLVAAVMDARMEQFQKQHESRQGETPPAAPPEGGGRRGGRRGGGMGPGDGGQGPGGGGMRGGMPEAEALQSALADEDATDAEIQEKLDAFRAARDERHAEMEAQGTGGRRGPGMHMMMEPSAELLAAQEALKAAVTVRQEATLVLLRTLQ